MAKDTEQLLILTGHLDSFPAKCPFMWPISWWRWGRVLSDTCCCLIAQNKFHSRAILAFPYKQLCPVPSSEEQERASHGGKLPSIGFSFLPVCWHRQNTTASLGRMSLSSGFAMCPLPNSGSLFLSLTCRPIWVVKIVDFSLLKHYDWPSTRWREGT